MKKTLVLALLLLSVVENSFSQEKALKIYNGKFAFAGHLALKGQKTQLWYRVKNSFWAFLYVQLWRDPLLQTLC